MSTRTTTARITSVEPLDGFVVRLRFDDGVERDLDLVDVLWGPVFAPLREDIDLFRPPGSRGRRARDDRVAERADLDPDVLHGDFAPVS